MPEVKNRAVSPVVGVAILVGITVILASVVGAFVFGIVDIGESSPDASFTYTHNVEYYSTDCYTASCGNPTDRNMRTVTVSHNSGDAIMEQELSARVSGDQSDPQSNESVYQIDYQGDDAKDGMELVLNETPGSRSPVQPGDAFRIDAYGIENDVRSGPQIWDYNNSDSNPPNDEIAFESTPESRNDLALKLGSCDIVEIVWQSASGSQGQVLQQEQLPGEAC